MIFRWPTRRLGIGRQRFALAGGAAILLGLAVWMVAAQWSPAASGQPTAAASKAAFEEVTGVRVLWVAVTAGGGMIDLRYQLLDTDKARVVHDRKRPPRLIHEGSGQVVSRPWMAHAHKRNLRVPVAYYQLLVNPGGVIKRGTLVTVAVGDARLEHVVVQ